MGIDKLVEISARRPWITILFWFLLVSLSGFVTFKFLASALTTNQTVSTKIESQQASDLIKDRIGRENRITELVIIKSNKFKLTDSPFREFVTNAQKDLDSLGKDILDSTVSFYQTQNPAFVSKNLDATYIVVPLKGDQATAEKNEEKIHDIVTKGDKNPDFEVHNSGLASINKDFQTLAEKDLAKGESIGLPVALVVLILVFGTVVAAFLPVILSLLSIAIALGLTALLGQIFHLSFFVTNMITMMGLAVGIDYSLFLISRFREERAKGKGKLDAITASGHTAGRAIFFSGITVVLALAGLLLVPSNIFRSLSIGAIFVVITAVFSALSLLPALLAILGDRINWLRIPFVGGMPAKDGSRAGFWNFVTRIVMKYPWISIELSAGILILASMPLFALNIGSSGVSTLPKDLPSRAGFDILRDEFSSGLVSPTQIVIDADLNSAKTKDSINKLTEKLQSNPLIPAVQTDLHPDKNLAIINLPISAASDKATKTVEKIRKDYIPDSFSGSGANVYVGGSTAENLDFTNIVKTYLPIVFAFVLGLSFILLTLVFRSLVVPIKAIIMNLLSVGAAYGLLVLVIQKGFGNELFGFQQSPQIESWIPVFLFAILFGLSMDYHVFLLSRIRERFDQTKNNDEAVAFGLSSTARLITGAALIMVAVFAAFASGSLVMFQQVGFGLAVAILFDATIVRTILVPASMKLLGNANWYLPSWLQWLPKIGIEG